MKKRVIALFLCVAVIAALFTGCGKLGPEHIVRLVQGTLDQNYLALYDVDYLKLAQLSEKDAADRHNINLNDAANTFAVYFDIDYMTDSLQDEIMKLYSSVYEKARYTVADEAVLQDDGTYTVELTVQPLDLFVLVLDDFSTVTETYTEQYVTGVDTGSMTSAEYQQYLLDSDAAWANLIVLLCREKLSACGYMDAVTVTAILQTDTTGEWFISNLTEINETVVYYPASA